MVLHKLDLRLLVADSKIHLQLLIMLQMVFQKYPLSILTTGMVELLNYINRQNLPCAIVTRNSKTASEMKLKQNNINIDIVLTRECYPAKPAPDALNAIAEMWQIPPKNLLYVGDYLYDIQAANNAGMIACFINHGIDTHYQHLADVIVKSLAELLTILKKHSIKKAL